MTLRVPMNPVDVTQHGPWQPDCLPCAQLRKADEPGVLMWLLEVANHFSDAHDIVLVGAPERAA